MPPQNTHSRLTACDKSSRPEQNNNVQGSMKTVTVISSLAVLIGSREVIPSIAYVTPKTRSSPLAAAMNCEVPRTRAAITGAILRHAVEKLPDHRHSERFAWTVRAQGPRSGARRQRTAAGPSASHQGDNPRGWVGARSPATRNLRRNQIRIETKTPPSQVAFRFPDR